MKIKLSKSQWENMGIKVSQTNRKINKGDAIKGAVENLPQYSINLECVKWDYATMQFSFVDNEDNKKYSIGPKELSKGYDILKKKVEDKQLHFHGLTWNDISTWDADVVDALVQCSIFGNVIYG